MNGPSDPLSPQVRAFLYSCIDSIEQLDVLLLMRTSSEPRSAHTVGVHLAIPDARARAHLDALTARGLLHAVVRDGVTYSFRPASAALARYCDELAAVFEHARGELLRFVAALPPPAVRSFAKAFKLRDSE
jgi:hypothetical protein